MKSLASPYVSNRYLFLSFGNILFILFLTVVGIYLENTEKLQFLGSGLYCAILAYSLIILTSKTYINPYSLFYLRVVNITTTLAIYSLLTGIVELFK